MKKIIANLKLYLNTIEEVKIYQNAMKDYKEDFIVAPQSIYLENFVKNGFTVAAQNVSNKENGSYTGEISPSSLADLNVKYVIIGHSEVRKRFLNEEKYIADKIYKSLANNIKVILCVGEEEYEDVYDVIDKQLFGIIPNDNLFISYEPIWAIGKNSIPELNKLNEIICYIKNKGYKTVLYGGSINENNIALLNKLDVIDGFLIGSSAADVVSFKKIIEVVR